jgi:hypothetical protein
MASIEVQESENDQTDEQIEPIVDETPPEEQPNPVSLPHKEKSRLGIILLFLVVLGLIAGGLFLLNDRNKLKKEVNKLASQSQVNAPDEAAQLNGEVHKLVELSTTEVPSVATVADADKLRQQSTGFENAQKGDKLLIYTQLKEIVVYRPSTKKVVSIVQISLAQAAPTTGTAQKKQ